MRATALGSDGLFVVFFFFQASSVSWVEFFRFFGLVHDVIKKIGVKIGEFLLLFWNGWTIGIAFRL